MVEGSYRTFGNNGTHRLNQPVNSGQNTAASRIVLNALAQTSDHLPVVVDYQIPAWMNVATSSVPSRIIRGTEVSLDVDVSNIAPVTVSNAADELDYQLIFEIDTPDNALKRNGFVNATASERVSLILPTEQVRNRVFRLRIQSDSESVVDGRFLDSGFYSVVAPAVPSWIADSQVTEHVIDLGFVPLSEGSEEEAEKEMELQGSHWKVPLALHNLSATEQTASLQLGALSDSVADDAISLAMEPVELLPAGGTVDLTATLDTSLLGTFSSTFTLNVSDDQAIFGATETQMVLAVMGQVAIPGDANGDNSVAFDDFLVVSRTFGSSNAGWTDGDFDLDQRVAFSDFLLLARNFGFTAASFATPEPTSGLPLAVALAMLPAFRRKRRVA